MKRRHKGSGTFFKRGDIWYWRTRFQGVERTVSTGKTSRVEAEKFVGGEVDIYAMKSKERRLREIQWQIADVNARMDMMRRGLETMTLGELWGRYEASPRRKDLSRKQLEVHKRACMCVVREFGEKREVSSITDRDAEKLAKKQSVVWHARTYNAFIRILRVIWDVMKKDIGDGPNPWRGIAMRRLDTCARRAMTDEEIGRLLNNAKGDMRTFLTIGAYTGLRLGDCAQLKWSDVDMDRREIRVVTAKTGAKVAIPLHPRLEMELRGLLHTADDVLPRFASIYRRKLIGRLTRMVQREFSKAGIETSVVKDGRKRPVCTFHSFRHTFVSRALEAGVPEQVVRAVVGHANALMTERYTHVTDAQILRDFRRIK